jgi:hypothetical protein
MTKVLVTSRKCQGAITWLHLGLPASQGPLRQLVCYTELLHLTLLHFGHVCFQIRVQCQYNAVGHYTAQHTPRLLDGFHSASAVQAIYHAVTLDSTTVTLLFKECC